jgi:hypothetical protein
MEENLNIQNNEKEPEKNQYDKYEYDEFDPEDLEGIIFYTEEQYKELEEEYGEFVDWFFDERIDEIERFPYDITEKAQILSLVEKTEFEKMLTDLELQNIKESIVTESELENAIRRKKQAKQTFEYITWSSYILGWFLLFFLQFIWRMKFIHYMVFITSLWAHALFICFISSKTYPKTVPLQTYIEVLYGGMNVKSL